MTQSWSPLARATTIIENKVIQKIAKYHDKSVSQVVLRWQYQLGAVTVPRSSSHERQLENLSIFDFFLDDTEMSAISGLTSPDGRLNNQDPATYEEF